MAEEITVRIQCKACGGTGVYRGLAEPVGVGVVCQECNGTGYKEITYIPFTERRRRDDVTTVCRSGGRLIAFGAGPTAGSGISYEDFLAGKKPI